MEDSTLQKAISEFEKKNYQTALQYLSELIKLKPEKADYYNYKGSVYLNIKNMKEALICFQTALKINPSHYNYKINSINCLIELERNEEASKLLEEASKISNTDPYLFYWRGRLFLNQKLFNQALFEFNLSINISKNIGEVFFWKAICLKEMKNYEESKENFELAISRNIEITPNLYYEMGSLFVRMEMYNSSLKEFEKAISLDSKNAKYYITKGNIYFKLNQFENALTEYSKILIFDKDNSEAYHLISKILLKNGKLDDALKNVNKALNYENENSDYCETKGLILYNQKNFDESIKFLLKGLSNKHNPIGEETIEKIESIISKYQTKITSFLSKIFDKEKILDKCNSFINFLIYEIKKIAFLFFKQSICEITNVEIKT